MRFSAGLETVLGRIDGREDLSTFAVVPLTFIGQGKLTGTAGNQFSTQLGFQRSQDFADGGLAGLHLSGNGRKAAAFDHPDEDRHCIEFVHGISH